MQDEDKPKDKYTGRVARMIQRWAGKRLTFSRKSTDEGQILQHTPPAPGEMDADQGVYIEPPKALPILAECEVLVVGAGPAGLSAALAARRAGADVILLERFGCFGGVITTVGMETLAWYRYEGTVESEGIGVEMERRAAAMGVPSNGRTTTASAWTPTFSKWWLTTWCANPVSAPSCIALRWM